MNLKQWKSGFQQFPSPPAVIKIITNFDHPFPLNVITEYKAASIGIKMGKNMTERYFHIAIINAIQAYIL